MPSLSEQVDKKEKTKDKKDQISQLSDVNASYEHIRGEMKKLDKEDPLYGAYKKTLKILYDKKRKLEQDSTKDIVEAAMNSTPIKVEQIRKNQNNSAKKHEEFEKEDKKYNACRNKIVNLAKAHGGISQKSFDEIANSYKLSSDAEKCLRDNIVRDTNSGMIVDIDVDQFKGYKGYN